MAFVEHGCGARGLVVKEIEVDGGLFGCAALEGDEGLLIGDFFFDERDPRFGAHGYGLIGGERLGEEKTAFLEREKRVAEGGLADFLRELGFGQRSAAMQCGDDGPLPVGVAAVGELIGKQGVAFLCAQLESGGYGTLEGFAQGTAVVFREPCAELEHLRRDEGIGIGEIDEGLRVNVRTIAQCDDVAGEDATLDGDERAHTDFCARDEGLRDLVGEGLLEGEGECDVGKARAKVIHDSQFTVHG